MEIIIKTTIFYGTSSSSWNTIENDSSFLNCFLVKLFATKGVYNASKHPDVQSGKKTEEEVLGDFLDTFEQHHAI